MWWLNYITIYEGVGCYFVVHICVNLPADISSLTFSDPNTPVMRAFSKGDNWSGKAAENKRDKTTSTNGILEGAAVVAAAAVVDAAGAGVVGVDVLFVFTGWPDTAGLNSRDRGDGWPDIYWRTFLTFPFLRSK